MKAGVFIGLLVAAALILGFYQERLKISINYVIENSQLISGFFEMNEQQRKEAIEMHRVVAPFDYYHNHTTIPWLYRMELHQLAALKWIVTAFFLAAFCAFNIALLKTLQKGPSLTRAVLITYGVLVPFAFMIYLSGRFTGLSIESYAFSRKILGALQSVIPSMIIWPAAQLWVLNIKMKSE
jgi:hypothetical protein